MSAERIGNMKKFHKRKIWMIIILPLMLIIVAYFAIRFTWRIVPGYYFCDNPSGASIYIAKNSEQKFTVDYIIANLGHFYEGYKCKIESGTMYLGVKTIFLFGIVPGDSVTFTISVNENVDKVILVGKGHERVIYPTPTE